jgi:hypothetical protein
MERRSKVRIVPEMGTLKERVLGILNAEDTMLLKTRYPKNYFTSLITDPDSRIEVRRIIPTSEGMVWADFIIHYKNGKKAMLCTKYRLLIGKNGQIIVRFNGELLRAKYQIEDELEKRIPRNLKTFWRRAPGSFGANQ